MHFHFFCKPKNNEFFNDRLLIYVFNMQTGPKEITEKSQGVNYRALSDLFLIADQRRDTVHYDVSVQMIEIYNEQVRDLLVTDGTNKRYPFTSYLILFGFVQNNISPVYFGLV